MTCLVLCLSLLIASSCAAPRPGNVLAGLPESASPLSSQFHAQDLSGQYSYGYASVDGSHKTENRAADGTITGSYGYVGPDGKLININYIANELGFQAISDDGSIVPPTLPDPTEDDYYEEDPEPIVLPPPQPAPAPIAHHPPPAPIAHHPVPAPLPPQPAPVAPPPPSTIAIVSHVPAPVAPAPAPQHFALPPSPLPAPIPKPKRIHKPIKTMVHHTPAFAAPAVPAAPTPIFGYATYEYAVPASAPAAPAFSVTSHQAAAPVAHSIPTETRATHSGFSAAHPVMFASPSFGVNGIQFSKVIGGFKLHV